MTFFSPEYVGRSDLFEGLEIWQYEEFRKLQGTIPVVSITFGGIRPQSFEHAVLSINALLEDTYSKFVFLKKSDEITDGDRRFFDSVMVKMDSGTPERMLPRLCGMLVLRYGRNLDFCGSGTKSPSPC